MLIQLQLHAGVTVVTGSTDPTDSNFYYNYAL